MPYVKPCLIIMVHVDLYYFIADRYEGTPVFAKCKWKNNFLTYFYSAND